MHKKSWDAAVASTDHRVAVALLSETREFAEQLRDALVSFGAPVVYEAATGELDRDALERSQANVVVVNLDARNDADLDEVYRLLDDERYRVIFNDGDVSSTLTGWDHARWLRHLAAKVLGAADLDPPRPADAKAVPVPAAVAVPAAATVLDDVPLEAAPAVAHVADALPVVEPVIEEAAPSVPLVDPTLLEVANADIDLHDFGVPDVQAHAVDDDPFDLDALIAMPAAPPLSGEAAPEASLAASPAEAEIFDASAFDDFALEFGEDEARTVSPAAESIHPEPHSGLDDFAATAFEPEPLVESIAAVANAAPVDIDIDFDTESVPASLAAASSAADGGAHLEWTLEEMFDDLDVPPPTPVQGRPAQPSDFGIEKLSAEEFLAPADDETSAQVRDEPVGFSLELVPLEEAVAPTQVESTARENWLDPDAVKVRRVWVLGASIGGPEAVREFLAAIPRDYPALFLLAQHLGEEFVDMMTNQLAQATPLTVRRAAHGERVGHGEVIVVPTSQRLRVDAQGVVVLERDAGETEFSPSIDRVIRDIADRFGAGAGAIVFSGMSSDAIEGCRHLAEKGGTVYAQRPETCVVSSMVNGVIDTGVVNFLGSPQELAEKLLAAA